MWTELEKLIENSEFYYSLSKVLKLLCQVMSASRCNFWQVEDHYLMPVLNYEAEKDDYILDQLKALDLNHVPRYYQGLLKRKILFLPDVHKHRVSAELSEIYWDFFGIKSSVDFVLKYKGKLAGVVCIEFKNKRNFSEEEKDQLKKMRKLMQKSYTEAQKLQEISYGDTLKDALFFSDISVIVTDRSGIVRFVNDAFKKMTGYTTFETIGKKLSFLNSGYHTKEFYRDLWRTILAGKVWRGIIINRKKNGEIFYEKQTILPLFRGSKRELVGFFSLGYDATEEVRLQRARFVVEETNKITRTCSDEYEILKKVCDMLYNNAEWRLVWVGKRAGNRVEVVYGIGRTEYLNNIQISLDEQSPLSKGPTGRAFLTGKIVAFNNLEDISQYAPWREKALSFGFRSSISVPIKVKDVVEYTINLYASEKNYFTEEYIKTLDSVSHEIELALESLRLREELKRMEFYDYLTGFPNRKFFLEKLKYSIELAKRYGKKVFLFMVDIFNFSLVNASYGSWVGDSILVIFGQKLREMFPEAFLIGRTGADEFCVVGFFDKHIQPIVEKMEKLKEIKIELGHMDMVLHTNMSFVSYPKDAQDERTLFEKGMLALKKCIMAGKASCCLYDSSMDEEFKRTAELQKGIFRALKEDEFLLYYQPIVDMKTLRVTEAEALLRWYSKEKGFISPGLFIPIAESRGLMREIDKFVLRKSQDFIHRIRDVVDDSFRVCVNLTPSNFDLLTEFFSDEYFIGHLEVELTEREFFEVFRQETTLRMFMKLGGRLSIDDFGTGYSSLAYLLDIPAQSLKIDISFVRRLEEDEKVRKLVSVIVDVSKNFGMKSIAEGVETQGQYEILRDLGCDSFQGYYFSPPVSEEAFVEKFLRVCF